MSELPPDDAERMYMRLDAQLGRERGARGWLRSRPSAQRAWLFALASLALSVAAAWALVGPARLVARGVAGWFALGGLAIAAAVAAGAMLRPLWLPAWSGDSRRLLVAGVGLAALASIAMSGDGSLGHLSDGRCVVIGLCVGGPIFALALMLDRQPRRVGVFRAITAGLVGAFAVQLICPAGGLMHLVVEHFGVAVAGTAIFAGIGQLLARRSG